MPYQNINVIRPQSPEAPLHRGSHFLLIMNMNLRLNEHFLPISFEDLTHHFFIAAVHIAVRGIVEIDPEVEGPEQHRGIAAIHHAHTHSGYFQPCLAEGSKFKGRRLLGLFRSRTGLPNGNGRNSQKRR